MQSDTSLLNYLHGKISFNDWLERQSEKLEVQDNLSGKQYHGYSSKAEQWQRESSGELLNADIGGKCYVDEYATPYLMGSSLKKKIIANDALVIGKLDSHDNDVDESFSFKEQEKDCTISFKMITPQFEIPDVSNIDDSQMEVAGMNLLKLIKKMSQFLSYITTAQNTDGAVDESFTELIRPKAKKLKKSGPSSHKLREDLRRQMGVANLYLAKGQIGDAVEACMEIVRQAPHNPHAFKTLSVIYDEKGDFEKSLQFALISAFIGCRDPLEWRDLAQRCLQFGNRKQALVCYSRACKFASKNIVFHWEKASLLFENLEYRKALDTYHAILKLVVITDGDKMIEFAKDIAQAHHSYDQFEKAIEILEFVFQKYPANIDSEGLNMLAELHLSSKDYERALQVMCTYSGVQLFGVISCNLEEFDKRVIHSNDKPPETTSISPYHLEETASLISCQERNSIFDLSSKVARSFVHEKDWATSSRTDEIPTDLSSIPSSWTEFLLSPHEENSNGKQRIESTPTKDILDLDMQDAPVSILPESVVPVDLPIDIRVKIVLCLIQLKRHDVEVAIIEAILKPLFEEKLEDVGDLYLDIAEAYMDVGRCEDAIPYLKSLISTEKYSMAAVWLKLAECQQAAGYIDDAVDSYYLVIKLAPDQLSVRIELSNLCKSLGRMDEAVHVLSDSKDPEMQIDSEDFRSGFVRIDKKEDFILWYQKCTILHGQEEHLRLAENGYIFFINYFQSAAITRDDGLSKAMVWELLIKVLQAMVSYKCHAYASKILDKALTFRPYCENKRYRLELDFLGSTVFFLLKDYTRAFDMFRWALIRSEKRALQQTAMWNYFARIVGNMHDRKYHKYVLRLLFKQPAILPLIITNGHNAFLCGSYKYALGEYVRAFRVKPTEPMLSLCVGITYLHLACQRFTKYRHTSVLQGIAFILQYYQMRDKSQEACYNLGRAFHQIGLLHMSVIFYNKALSFPVLGSKQNDKQSQFVDLQREAAYNLSLIYKSSGNLDLARRTLYRYVSV